MGSKPKALFVSFNDINKQDYGGAQCSGRNFDALQKLCQVDYFHIKKKSNFSSFNSLVSGLFPPVSSDDCKKILSRIKVENYSFLFLDSSLLGILASKIKLNFDMPIIVYFHNVEFDYINVRFRWHSPLRWLYKASAWFNEKKILDCSDLAISLHDRDQCRLNSLYGYSTSVNIPISFTNRISDKKLESCYKKINFVKEQKDFSDCLFVGAFGEANYQGIRWFVNNVLPFVNVNLTIVGKGFESVKSEFALKNINVLGFVDDLESLYINADFVISPLLFGGGMKVKIAEALMYGKTIFGTSESFVGYDVDRHIGAVCDTQEQFVIAINDYVCNTVKYNEHSRALFKKKYCSDIIDLTFYKVLCDFL